MILICYPVTAQHCDAAIGRDDIGATFHPPGGKVVERCGRTDHLMILGFL